MNIISTQFGHQHGLGHLRRCLNLAREFRQQGRAVKFWFEDSPSEPPWLRHEGFTWQQGNLSEITSSINNNSSRIETLILDKPYPIPEVEVNLAHQLTKQVVTIDNAGPGVPEADLIFFPLTPIPDIFKSDPLKSKVFAGADFTIIEQEFLQFRNHSARENSEDILMSSHKGHNHDNFKILIAMGGTDAYNLTPQLLKWLHHIIPSLSRNFNDHKSQSISSPPDISHPITPTKLKIFIALGPLSQNRKQVLELADKFTIPVQVLIDPPNFSQLMAQADLGILTYGTIVYEAALLGLPTIIISTFPENQISAQWLSRYNFFVEAGIHTSLTQKNFAHHLQRLMTSLSSLHSMSENGKNLFDGLGTKRIVEKILSFQVD